MGDVVNKVMSVLTKIANKRRTLKKRSIVARHGWKVVIGCYLLGIITATAFSFVYYQSQELFNLDSYRSMSVHIVSAERVSAQSEVITSGPVEETSVSPSPTTIADLIWSRESSRGKNNFSKCEAKGMTNGIGMGVWGGNYMCFRDHAEEMEVLDNWIARHIEEGLSYIELICHYSGNNYPECNQ